MDHLNFGVLRTPRNSISKLELLRLKEPQSVFSEKIFLDSVLFSNTKFHKKILKWINNEITDSKEKQKILITAYNYYSRLCSRPTPFGMFSDIHYLNFNSVKTDEVESIKYQLPNERKISIDLDATIINHIVIFFKQNQKINSLLTFSSNNSIYEKNDYIYYYNFTIEKDLFIKYVLVKVDSNDLLVKLLRFCDLPRTQNDIVAFIMNDNDYTLEDSIAYVKELINSNIFISEIDALFFQKDSLNKLIEILRRLSNTEKKGGWIQKIKKLELIVKTLKNKVGIDLIEVSNKVSILLEDFDVQTQDYSSQFQLESNYRNDIEQKININHKLISELQEVRNLFSNLYHINTKRLEDFKKRFSSRYGESRVNLLSVIDPLEGVGYVLHNESIGNLEETKGIFVESKKSKQITLSSFELLLIQELQSSQNMDLIDLSLLNLKTSNASTKQSNSILAFISLLNNGKSIYLREFNEVTATKFLNRFGTQNKKIYTKLKELTLTEDQQVNKEFVVQAEVKHIPEVRMANLIKFDDFREYQINCVFPSNEQSVKAIPIGDLEIQVINSNVFLFSKKLNKVVKPIISNSLNPSAYPLDVFTLLHDLQGQDNNFNLGFEWNNLGTVFNELPRVQYKNIILYPKTWVLKNNDLALIENDFEEWVEIKKIPNQLLIASNFTTDQKLYVDISIEICRSILIDQLKKNKTLIINEVMDVDNSCFTDSNGDSYRNEIMLPLTNKFNCFSGNHFVKYNSLIKERFMPGEKWLYLKIYCSNTIADELLNTVIFKKMQLLIKSNQIKKWFFIRYSDDNFHIRLRLELINNNDFQIIYHNVVHAISKYIQNQRVFKINIDTYNREIHRYGASRIDLCEELFFYDSQIVLTYQVLKRTDQFNFSAFLVSKYLDFFEFTAKERMDLFKIISGKFIAEFNGGKKLKLALNKKYRNHSDTLDSLFTMKYSVFDEMFGSLLSQLNQAIKKLMLKTENSDKNQLVISLIHMSLNRTFKSNPRFNEMYVYYILEKHFTRTFHYKNNQ